MEQNSSKKDGGFSHPHCINNEGGSSAQNEHSPGCITLPFICRTLHDVCIMDLVNVGSDLSTWQYRPQRRYAICSCLHSATKDATIESCCAVKPFFWWLKRPWAVKFKLSTSNNINNILFITTSLSCYSCLIRRFPPMIHWGVSEPQRQTPSATCWARPWHSRWQSSRQLPQ